MRFFLTLLFLLHITLSIAPFVPHAAPDVGDIGGDAAGDAGGVDTSGKDSSGSDNTQSGCIIDSCSSGQTGSGSTAGSSGATNSGEDKNEAADIIEHIHDVLDAIQSIISLVTSTSDSSTYTITTEAPLPTAARACLSAQSIYNACANNSGSDFTDQVVSQQASCLCYEQFGSVNQTTSWVPGVFDGFVSLCDEFVATQTVVSVSATVTGAAVTGATGVCKGVGDVRASASASVAAATSSSTPAPSPIVPPTSSGGRSRERGMGYRGMLLVLGAILGWIRM